VVREDQGRWSVNVKLSHEEVITACEEWMLKHHRLIASKLPCLTFVSNSAIPKDTRVCIEFPGIEPNEDKPETPYRG
jgi:hypothetical protein